MNMTGTSIFRRFLTLVMLVLVMAAAAEGQIKKGGGRVPYCTETVRPQIPICMKAGYSKMVSFSFLFHSPTDVKYDAFISLKPGSTRKRQCYPCLHRL